jgi:hypothetical protein
MCFPWSTISHLEVILPLPWGQLAKSGLVRCYWYLPGRDQGADTHARITNTPILGSKELHIQKFQACAEVGNLTETGKYSQLPGERDYGWVMIVGAGADGEVRNCFPDEDVGGYTAWHADTCRHSTTTIKNCRSTWSVADMVVIWYVAEAVGWALVSR